MRRSNRQEGQLGGGGGGGEEGGRGGGFVSIVRRQAPADQLTAGLTHFQLPTANKQTNNQKNRIKYYLKILGLIAS